MKCKGIIFSGFMGTLLAVSSAYAAEAVPQLASTQYVDRAGQGILQQVQETYETKETVNNLTEQVTNLESAVNNPETGLSAKVDKAASDAAQAKQDASDAKSGLTAKEDSVNKVETISAENQSSPTQYPSVGAIVQWTNDKISELSTEGLPVNPENIPDGSISTNKIANDAVTEDKLSNDVVSKIDSKVDASYVDGQLGAKEDKSNKTATLAESAELASDDKYPTEKAVVSALAGKQAAGDYATKSDLEGFVDESALAGLATKEELAGYATTAALEAKEDKSNKIQAISEDSTSDQYPSAVAVRDALSGKADKTALEGLATKAELDQYAKTESLATVATTGSYNDLQDKPVIPEGAVVDSELTPEGTNAVQGKVIYEALQGKQNALTPEQLQAVDSGITSEKVATYDGYAAEIGKKLDSETASSTYATQTSVTEGLATKQDKLSYTPENSANKVTAIDSDNKTSSTSFPSVGAVTEWTEQRISELSTEGLPVNPDNIGAGAITEEKLAANSVSTVKIVNNAVTEEKLSVELQETIEGKVDSSALGTLAYESEVSNAQIAANAGIEKSKLATDVQETLDSAVTTADAGVNKILGTDENGDKVWYDIVFE